MTIPVADAATLVKVLGALALHVVSGRVTLRCRARSAGEVKQQVGDHAIRLPTGLSQMSYAKSAHQLDLMQEILHLLAPFVQSPIRSALSRLGKRRTALSVHAVHVFSSDHPLYGFLINILKPPPHISKAGRNFKHALWR